MTRLKPAIAGVSIPRIRLPWIRLRRWGADRLPAAAEALAAIAAAVLSVQLSRSIVVDPLSRVGQVSGVAGLDFRFVVLGLVLLGGCLLAGWRDGPPGPWSGRCAYAAVAGLTTGLIGGGIVLALRGTDWPLFANGGDSGQLIHWADNLIAGRAHPGRLPPGDLPPDRLGLRADRRVDRRPRCAGCRWPAPRCSAR